MSLHILALETSSARCGVALLLRDSGGIRLVERYHDGATEHSERLLPMVDAVLAEAGVERRAIDAVAFGQGPGGFTGLRVACGVAQGMGFALGIPLLPVVSHAAVESLLPADAPAVRVIVLDARMQEFYVAVYCRNIKTGVTEVRVLQPPVLMSAASFLPWLAARAGEWCPAPEAGHAGGLIIAGDCLGFPEPAVGAGVTVQQALPGLPPAVHSDAGLAALDACRPTWWPSLVRPTAAAVARLGLDAWDNQAVVAPADAHPLYVRDKVAFTTTERMQGPVGGNPRAGEPQ